MSEEVKNVIETGRDTRSAVQSLLETRKAEATSFLDNGEVSTNELAILRLGLEELRRAANSPETLLTFCKTNVLGIDLKALEEQGLIVDSKLALKGQTKEAKRRLKAIRTKLDQLLSDRGVIQEMHTTAYLHENESPEIAADLDEGQSAFEQKLAKLDLPESMRSSFIGRALESRKQAEEEMRNLQTPAERLRTELNALMDELNSVLEQIILSVEIQRGEPFEETLSIDELLKATGKPAELFFSQKVNLVVDRVEESFKEASESWQLADTKERAQAVAAIAALIGVYASMLAGSLHIGGVLGNYSAGCYEVFGIATLAVLASPKIRKFGREWYDDVKARIDTFQQAFSAAAGIKSETVRPQITEATPDLDAEDMDTTRRRMAAAQSAQTHRTL